MIPLEYLATMKLLHLRHPGRRIVGTYRQMKMEELSLVHITKYPMSSVPCQIQLDSLSHALQRLKN